MFAQSVPSVYFISVVFGAYFMVVAFGCTAITDNNNNNNNCPANIENACKQCARISFYGRGEWNQMFWVITFRWVVSRNWICVHSSFDRTKNPIHRQRPFSVRCWWCMRYRLCSPNANTCTNQKKKTLTSPAHSTAKCHLWNLCATIFRDCSVMDCHISKKCWNGKCNHCNRIDKWTEFERRNS